MDKIYLGFTVEEISAITMAIIFVASFLVIFFFTYAAKIEEQVVKNQVNFIIQDFIKPFKIFTSTPQTTDTMKLFLNSISLPNMDEEDKKVAEHNKEVLMGSLKIIGSSFIVVMIILYYMSKHFNFSFGKILKENLIIICFVGLTEFMFLTYLGSKYISADPNFVKKTLINKLMQI